MKLSSVSRSVPLSLGFHARNDALKARKLVRRLLSEQCRYFLPETRLTQLGIQLSRSIDYGQAGHSGELRKFRDDQTGKVYFGKPTTLSEFNCALATSRGYNHFGTSENSPALKLSVCGDQPYLLSEDLGPKFKQIKTRPNGEERSHSSRKYVELCALFSIFDNPDLNIYNFFFDANAKDYRKIDVGFNETYQRDSGGLQGFLDRFSHIPKHPRDAQPRALIPDNLPSDIKRWPPRLRGSYTRVFAKMARALDYEVQDLARRIDGVVNHRTLSSLRRKQDRCQAFLDALK